MRKEFEKNVGINSKKSERKFKKVTSLKDRTHKKNKQNKKKSNFYYSILTIVLLIFLCQVAFSAVLNITKNIAYTTKISTIKKTKNQAEKKNKQLRKELKEFSSSASLEAIARNNLKMAGDNEVLIIINDIKKQNSEETEKKKSIFNLGKK